MIVVKLMGGLGNQMFQYALGRTLSIRNKTSLKLDVSFFKQNEAAENYTIRNYELQVFNIQSELATQEELKAYSVSKFTKIKHHFLLRTSLRKNALYVREPHFHFFGKALQVGNDAYLDGYWQSEKYFANIRNALLNDFTTQMPLSLESTALAQKIKLGESVSLHVRKSDYIKDSVNSKIYGVITKEYYLAAMDKIASTLKSPVFYIFSDEPGWFENNISTKYNTVLVNLNKGSNSYQDLILMSLCKHNIIANSSFSWWGAWLNQNKAKKVIAPKNWFIDPSKSTKDLIPQNWLML